MVAAPATPQAPTRPVQRYEPRGGARELMLANEPEVLIVGAAGTGKTLAACYKLHLDLLRYPGSRVLMARKVLEDLKSGALSTLINTVQPKRAGVKEFGGNRFYPAEFRYPNGSVLLVVGLDKPGKVMSSEFDKIYVNEATEIDLTDLQLLKSRLRNGKMPVQQLIMDCNPASPRHWLNLRCNAGLTRRILSTHQDNPAYWDYRRNDWTPLGRQYVMENLGSLTGVEYERLFEGKWVAAEGLVYPEFKPEMIRPTYDGSEIDAFDNDGNWLPDPKPREKDAIEVDVRGWRRIMAADIGSRNPTAIGRLHIAGDERVHVSRCLYRRNMTSTDILDAIRDEADEFDPEAIYIDPSAKGIIDDLVREGYPVEAANNDVIDGIRQVRAVLARGFTIDPSCIEMIDEFGQYAYPAKPRIETDKPEKKHDHAMDMLRYGAMGATEPVLTVGLY